jgi:hypothetical protein
MRGIFSPFRVLSFALALGVFLSGALPAKAQSTGSASVKIGQASAIKRKLPLRQVAQKPYWVSRSDCLNHDIITYPITMTGYSGLELQVWAGTVDCTPPAQRVGGSGSTCWQVFGKSYTQQELAGGGFNIPIFARNLVAVASRPTLTSSQTGTVEADASVCNQGQGAAPALALYFMLVDGTATIINNAVAIWKDTTYDITPPAPPTNLVTGGGEGHLNLTWTRSTDSDITGYNFYCDPPAGALASGKDGGVLSLGPTLGTLVNDSGLAAGGFTGTAGATSDGGAAGIGGASGAGGLGAGGFGGLGGIGGTVGVGGTSGATAVISDGGVIVVHDAGATSDSNQTCGEPTVLGSGVDPSAFTDAEGHNPYFCGHATGISVESGKAEGLINGNRYVVAVGAVDTVGNVGKLSASRCDAPVQVTDFFELYRDLGGQGGCSISRRTRASGWVITALGVIAGSTMLRRRRRRS